MLEMNAFTNSKVLAGHNGINSNVYNATLIDAPDGYKWCKKGDFIVTTGYPFSVDRPGEPGLMQLLEKLTNKECAGIGIKLGRYINSVPEEVISYANKNNLPIITLPNELSWSDVIVPVIAEINKQHKYELEMTHKVYEYFHNHLKLKGNLQDLAHLLHSVVELPVTIYIKNSNKIINTHDVRFPIKEIENIIASLCFGENQTIQKLNWNNIDFTVRWIFNSNRLTAGVFLWGSDFKLNTWNKAALEQTAVITALEIERLKAISTTYQHFRNEFLGKLLNENELDTEVIFRTAKEVNWDLEDEYKIVLLDCILDTPSESTNLPVWQKKLDILEDFENELKWLLPRTLIGLDLQNRFILLVPHNDNDDKFIGNLKKLIKKVNLNSVYGGVGGFNNIDELSSSYKEAILASEVAYTKMSSFKSVNKENLLYIQDFHKLDVERILFSEDPKTESKTIAKKYLQKVLDYDIKKNSELITTLKSFINNNANYDDTADELFIHKNTVRYRINKIYELTSLNPSKMTDLLLLQIAITTIDILCPQDNP